MLELIMLSLRLYSPAEDALSGLKRMGDNSELAEDEEDEEEGANDDREVPSI